MDDYKLTLGILLAVFGILFSLIKYRDEKRRIAFINSYNFSTTVKERFRQQHSSLSDEAVEEVFIALKDFFIFNVKNKNLSMPSQIVDKAWHAFILITKEYQVFCEGAYGRFLHHRPSEPYKKESFAFRKKAEQSLREVWKAACKNEGIDRLNPKKLPRLFAIDKLLNVKGGHYYSHLEHPPGREVSAFDIKCDSDWAGSGCSGE